VSAFAVAFLAATNLVTLVLLIWVASLVDY
jgi:hypothetical protein